MPGQFVPIGGGKAFIPDPLPPKLDFDPGLARRLAEASEALGRLDGLGRTLPNPHLLVRPFIRVEAVLSSRIEGTQASLTDLYAAEAQPALFPTLERRDDVIEVRNYVRALEYGLKRRLELPIGSRLLREMHAMLLEGARGRNRAPGAFRSVQNWVGGSNRIEEAAYIPPPPQEVPRLIAELERYIHSDSPYHALVDIALVHYQFEAIHPFLDGNGRIGRLLITLMLVDRGLLASPLLYLSAYFERNRGKYYDLLLDVTLKDHWRAWLDFFLEGVRVQSLDAIERARALVELRERYRETLQQRRAGPALHAVAEHLFARPVFSIRQLERELSLSYAAVNQAVSQLTKLGWIVETTGQKRNRLFTAFDVLRILNPSGQ